MCLFLIKRPKGKESVKQSKLGNSWGGMTYDEAVVNTAPRETSRGGRGLNVNQRNHLRRRK